MALRQTSVVLAAAVIALAAAAASLTLGAVHVPLHDVLDALAGRAEAGPLKEIVLALRVPRTVEAIVVGAALGVAGVLLQGALGNPLASPDIVGVTGGAGFGAILVLLAFPGAIALLPVGALAFGLLAGALVLTIAWSGPSGGATGRLILAGIAVSALFGAATTSLMVAYSAAFSRRSCGWPVACHRTAGRECVSPGRTSRSASWSRWCCHGRWTGWRWVMMWPSRSASGRG